LKVIYTQATLDFIFREKGIETANELIKSGTVKTILGETKETDVNYLVIEDQDNDNQVH